MLSPASAGSTKAGSSRREKFSAAAGLCPASGRRVGTQQPLGPRSPIAGLVVPRGAVHFLVNPMQFRIEIKESELENTNRDVGDAVAYVLRKRREQPELRERLTARPQGAAYDIGAYEQ